MYHKKLSLSLIFITMCLNNIVYGLNKDDSTLNPDISNMYNVQATQANIINSNYIEKGIDVSTWQGQIDWLKVKKDGIDFAIIRAGFGRNEPRQVDVRFHENMKNAQAAGIKCGAYHYSYAKSPEDAKNEANFFLSIIKGYKFDYPVVFDIEDQSMKKLGKRTLTDICKTFCSTVKKQGYHVAIYSNPDFLRNNLYANELKEYGLWLAHYNDTPAPDFDYHIIWQCTRSGQVNGINGNVDINYSKYNFNLSKNENRALH